MSQISQISERDPRTFAIIGAAVEVHSELGCGFLEPVYQEALALEFEQREIPFQREVELPVTYKGRTLGVCYRADFVCYDSVVVELKAVNSIRGVEESQIIQGLGIGCRPIAELWIGLSAIPSLHIQQEKICVICEICG